MKKVLTLLILILVIGMAGTLAYAQSLAPEGSHDYVYVPTAEPVSTNPDAASADAGPTAETVSEPEPTPEPTPEQTPEPDFPAGVFKDKYTQATEYFGEQYLEYNVVVPENATKDMPLIIYLPGDGLNDSVDAIPDQEFALRVKEYYGDDFPFIELLPCTRYFTWCDGWVGEVLQGLIKHVVEEYDIDEDHIIITGYSRGAEGAWKIVEDMGDYFSCIVPVSCSADIHNYEQFKDVPVWAMYGDGMFDSSTYGSDIRYYVDRINEAGGNAKYTVVENADHSDMGYAAYTKDVIEWMIAQ